MTAFYTLTKGECAFGDTWLDRMNNIMKGKPINMHILGNCKARDFISWLISHKIDDRPYVDQALEHPFIAWIEEP